MRPGQSKAFIFDIYFSLGFVTQEHFSKNLLRTKYKVQMFQIQHVFKISSTISFPDPEDHCKYYFWQIPSSKNR